MAPQVFYYLAGSIALFLSLVAIIIELLRVKVGNRTPLSVIGAFIVGCSYSTYWMIFTLVHLLDLESAQLITYIAVLLFNPITAYFFTNGFNKNNLT